MRSAILLTPVLFLPVALLTACGGEEPPSAQESAARIAQIEEANRGTAIPVEPEPIRYSDIEANDLFGAGCAFAPAGGGMAPILLAMDDTAHMKIYGQIETFAPDKGTQKGPSLAWTKYDGRQHSLNLGLGQELGQTGDGGVMRYEARLTMRDGRDRIVYEAAGEAQCGS